MTEQSGKIEVKVKYKNVEQAFSASSLEEMWLLLNGFFSEFIPSFDVANKLWLSVDLKKLAEDCEGIIGFSEEGANLLVQKNKLTDNESLVLWLLASYVGYSLSLLGSVSLSKEDLQAKLGKSGKITSTRLGELVKNEWVARTGEDNFKITTFGISQVQKDILPKVKTKIQA